MTTRGARKKPRNINAVNGKFDPRVLSLVSGKRATNGHLIIDPKNGEHWQILRGKNDAKTN